MLSLALRSRRTNKSARLKNYSSLIDKVSYKTNAMSPGFVLLEQLFMRMLTQTDTLQSEAIMSADIKMCLRLKHKYQIEAMISLWF